MKSTQQIYQDENNNITSPKLFAELQQRVLWRTQEKVALFNALGPDHPGTIEATLRLAEAKTQVQDYDEALALTKEAYDAFLRIFGEEGKPTVDTFIALADAHLQAGDPHTAKEMAQQFLEKESPIDTEDVLMGLDAKEILADAYQDLHEFSHETKVRSELVIDLEQMYGPHHPETIISIQVLASRLRTTGSTNQAVPLYEKLLALMQDGQDYAGTVGAMTDLALCYSEDGRRGDALSSAQEAVRIGRQVLGENDASTLFALKALEQISSTVGSDSPTV